MLFLQQVIMSRFVARRHLVAVVIMTRCRSGAAKSTFEGGCDGGTIKRLILTKIMMFLIIIIII